MQAAAVLSVSLASFSWSFGDEGELSKRDQKAQQRKARKDKESAAANEESDDEED